MNAIGSVYINDRALGLVGQAIYTRSIYIKMAFFQR